MIIFFMINDWWKFVVVYQVYLCSFVDLNGDGIGDVCGIIDYFDYFVILGVDVLWILLWYFFFMVDGGYDVSDYCDINLDFGIFVDVDVFVVQVYELGLWVIIDFVLNYFF